MPLLPRLLNALRAEIPSCAYGLWIACVWLALAAGAAASADLWTPGVPLLPGAGELSVGDLEAAARFAVTAALLVFAVFGGAAATTAAQWLSPGRAPAPGGRGVAVAAVAAALSAALPAVLVLALAPTGRSGGHVASVFAVVFGASFAVNALATAAWQGLVFARPALRALAEEAPLGGVGWLALGGHAVLVLLPNLALAATLAAVAHDVLLP